MVLFAPGPGSPCGATACAGGDVASDACQSVVDAWCARPSVDRLRNEGCMAIVRPVTGAPSTAPSAAPTFDPECLVLLGGGPASPCYAAACVAEPAGVACRKLITAFCADKELKEGEYKEGCLSFALPDTSAPSQRPTARHKIAILQSHSRAERRSRDNPPASSHLPHGKNKAEPSSLACQGRSHHSQTQAPDRPPRCIDKPRHSRCLDRA